MFRSPNDITSSDIYSTEDDRDDDICLSPEDGQDGPESTASVGSGRYQDESGHELPPIPNLEPHGHSSFIFSSLLEHYCRSRAAKSLSEEDGSKRRRSSDDPEVRAMAESMYGRLSNQLNDYGIIGQGYENQAHEDVRDGYRAGLDYMLQNLNLEPAVDQSNGGGALQRRRGQKFWTDVNRPDGRYIDAGPFGAGASRLAEQDLRRMGFGDNMALALQPRAARMPPELRPSNDAFLPTSRYASDFSEVRILGKGGYGKVYEVVNRLDGQQYAIKKITLSPKRLKKLQQGGRSELDSLLRELRTLARLEHTNVVRYFNGWIERSESSLALDCPLDAHEKLIEAPQGAGLGALNGHSHDAGVVFEVSSASKESTEASASRMRRPSTTSTGTASSAGTKKSLAKVAEAESEEVEYVPRDFQSVTSGPTSSGNLSDFQFSDAGCASLFGSHGAKMSSEPQLVLHIQMSLHPISLSSYLFSDHTHQTLGKSHCFHIQPSLRLMLGILSGVEYLHGQGVVHRDLKPGNIFLSTVRGNASNGVNLSHCPQCKEQKQSTQDTSLVPRIGDFGLVAEIAQPEAFIPSASSSSPPSLPEQGPKLVGTEFYRPLQQSASPVPEQDVFALGVILFELLWQFETKMERYEALSDLGKGELPVDFSERVGDSSRKLAECICGMIDTQTGWNCKRVRQCLISALGDLESNVEHGSS